MTDPTPDDVERLANALDWRRSTDNPLRQKAADTLRALSVRVQELERERNEAMEPRLRVPDTPDDVLLACRYGEGSVAFYVASYWWTESSDTKQWTDDDGDLICDPNDAVAWWPLDPFAAAVLEITDQEHEGDKIND